MILSFKMLQYWWCEDDGLAAVEAALTFPVLLVMMLGLYDMGNGILANQKAIRASQIVADLVARDRSVDQLEINEIVAAGRLAFEPLDTGAYGVDIVSIRFDDEANPQIVWRETVNMSEMADVLSNVSALAEPDNGVVAVGVSYEFRPVFAGFVVDNIPMLEVAFSRGRKSAVVAKE
ncbi:MAG: pilus assembly protein [Micavibrio sp.]|nr:pilus assembly protein [Micavibrio sp.]